MSNASVSRRTTNASVAKQALLKAQHVGPTIGTRFELSVTSILFSGVQALFLLPL